MAGSSTGSMAKLSSGDEKALKDMAQANINEIAAAKIALNKAESSEVKAFAQKMVDDHGDALTKVQTVAKQKDVTLPTEPDAQHKAMADKLEEVKTICWCGKKAAFNARFDSRGRGVKEGEQVVLGANDRYTSLCRRHWMAGDLGPDFHIRRT